MDTWNKRHWDREYAEVQVIVTVPEIMRQIMQQRFITPDYFDCIILDECHHASGKHPMAKVCELLRLAKHECRVFGMTASPFAAKKGSMIEKVGLLEVTTGCRVVAPVDSLEELQATVPRPTFLYCCYTPRTTYHRLSDYFNSYDTFQSILYNERTPMLFYSDGGLVLLHSYYRVRHAYFLADVLRVYFSLQMSIEDTPEFLPIYDIASELFSQRERVGYHALADTQQLLGQIISILDDCGVLCALYAFDEAIKFSDKTAKYTSYSWIHDDTQYATGSGNRKDVSVMQSADEADGLPMVDLMQLAIRCQEVASGPYADHLQSMMHDHSMIWCSLLDVFCVLCVSLGEKICLDALAIIEQEIKKAEGSISDDNCETRLNVDSKTHTRALQSVMHILRTIGAGNIPSVAIGSSLSFDTSKKAFSKEHITQLRRALHFTCQSIVAVLPASTLYQAIIAQSNVAYLTLDKILEVSSSLSGLHTDQSWSCPLVSDGVSVCMREVLYRFPIQRSVYAKLKAILPEVCNVEIVDDDDPMSCDETNSTTSSDSSRSAKASDGWAAIIFCRMRLNTLALSRMFNDVMRALERGINSAFPILSTFLVGACVESVQQTKLQEFKTGMTNVLFATDVAEEGLDVRVCKLVINFHPPVTVKSFIQRRGRGRAVNSIMTSIIPCNTTGAKICENLLQLQQQEEALEKNVQQGLVSLLSVRNDDSNLSINAESDDEIFSEQELSEHVYTVSTTCAQADLQSAIQIVTHYCQHTPHDAYFCPDALYWMATDYSGCSNYRCSLLLPQCTPPEARCIIGDPASRKALAKGLAALQCVRMLHQTGELDDWLIPLTSKRRKLRANINITDSTPVHKKSKRNVTECDIDPNSSLGWDNLHDENPESIAKIAVKVVPDCMVPPRERSRRQCMTDQNINDMMTSNNGQNDPVCSGSAGTALHFYSWNCAQTSNSATCKCSKRMSEHASIQSIGIALLEAVPKDLLHEEYVIMHRNVPSRISLCFLGTRCVDKIEMIQYQRFHAAIALWQTHDSDTLFPPEEWIKSSNDAWYMLIPTKPFFECIYADSFEPTFPENWLDILIAEANNAQRLAHEIASYRDFVKECGGRHPPYRMNYNQTCDNLIGKLFYRGPGELYVGHAVRGSFRLDDLMLVQRTETTEDASMTPVRLTYADYFLSKNRITLAELDILRTNRDHRLVPCFPMAGRLTLVQLLDRFDMKDISANDPRAEYPTLLIPEHCTIIGDASLFLGGLMIPSLVWRLQSQLLAIEARRYIMNAQYFQKFQQLRMVDATITDVAIEAPPLSLFLTALTPRMTIEAMNSERLEFLGDSLLKYVTTWVVFNMYPTKQEGFLTKARGMVINNSYLATCASKLRLIQYLRALSLSTGKQQVRFAPPGYDSGRSLWNVNISKASSSYEYAMSSEAPRQYCVAEVKVKAVSDMMEAIIGCFYVHGGMDAGVAAIKALMLWPTLENTNMSGKPVAVNAVSMEEMPKAEVVAPPPPVIPKGYPPMLRRIAIGEAHININVSSKRTNGDTAFSRSLPLSAVEAIHELFGYNFRNVIILDEALTHCSIQYKQSNQRLEFLGDAVLDFAVVHLLNLKFPSAPQGQLTDLRSKSTCNRRLSALGLRLGLQKHIQAMSTSLIAEFADIQLWQSTTQHAEGCDNDKLQFEYIEKYGQKNGLKAIADAVEAIFGAIFIDSSGNFEVICEIVSRLHVIVDN